MAAGADYHVFPQTVAAILAKVQVSTALIDAALSPVGIAAGLMADDDRFAKQARQ